MAGEGSRKRRDRDLLVKDLRERFGSTMETGDPAPVMAAVVPGLARDLARILASGLHDGTYADITNADIGAMGLLVGVHGIRYQLLPEGQGQDDLRACLAWSSALLPIAPDLVPDPIRAHLTGAAAEATARGAALYQAYEQTGKTEHLHQAVTLFREAAGDIPPDDPGRPGVLSNLGNALQTRFERTEYQGDLDEAVTLFREAVAATPVDHPDRPLYLSNLGNALRARFEWTGYQSDLDEAITAGGDAVAATPVDHPDRPLYLSNLGNALRARFERTGYQSDLDEAITGGRDAVAATLPDHSNRPLYLSNLGNALRARFEWTGQQSDLDEAIRLFRKAVEAAPSGHRDRPMCLSNLGTALGTRFERAGQQADLDDLDEAITAGRDAVAATPPDHPNRPRRLSNLGNDLRVRFERTGQQSDLDEAITGGRDAVAATPSDHPNRPMCLSNLANALRARFERTGQQSDLDEAVILFREAVAATPPDHSGRLGRLSNLGMALRDRFARTGQQADLDEAITVCREGAGVVTESPGRRLVAARWWGWCGVLARDFGTAVEGYAAAIRLLPLVVWHGLDQETREHHLRESAGLASEAAAAAVAADDPVRAVELAEAGRAMLWTQALYLRHDLAPLQRRDPGLAAVLEHARAVLNRTPGGGVGVDAFVTADLDQTRAAERQMLEDRRQAAREWDAAVEQVRRLEGFEDFQRPVPFPQLRRAAAEGPVVLVNVSRHGSHALIVVPEIGPRSDAGPDLGVQVVDLPAASWETVIDQANTLLAARHRAGDLTADPVTQVNDQYAVFDVLAWTWQAITEPVLTALGHTTTPDGPAEKWPRVWWCPLGPAAVLPLHAAGMHPHTGIQYSGTGEATAIADTVAGRVVSSYTPTLAALTRARSRSALSQVRALVVGVPDAPDLRPLPGALPELEAVAATLRPTSTDATYMISPTDREPEPTFTVYSPPTRDTVLEALPRHSWLHLSCHGSQHPDDASRSAFWLRDAPLTLADLAVLDLPDADLAYLAACQTATGDVRMLDEALHLAAALQLVGYRHVLATLWSISDAAAPAMAEAIYAHLTHPDLDHPDSTDRPDSARAPYALHHAVTRLRQACPGEPLLWAPYIHLGP